MRTLVDYGYIAVFVLMMLQGMGIPIPSEVDHGAGRRGGELDLRRGDARDGRAAALSFRS